MSTGEKAKILDYLPPEERQKVLTLVQRLKEESEAKQKYIRLYNQSQESLNEMTLKCNKLKDENQHLKQQIHNSFSIVSQVRANFHANKQHAVKAPPKSEEEWEDESDADNEQNHQYSANNLEVPHKPPRNHHRSPLEKYRPPLTTSKKPANVLNLSNSELNQTHNRSRGKQIQDLRKQVQMLQEEKRSKQSKHQQIVQKQRLVEQIKNRYKNAGEQSQISNSKDKEASARMNVSETFSYEDHFAKTEYSNQKSSRILSSEQIELPKSINPKQRLVKNSQRPLQSEQKPNRHVITSQDYGDVLDMINDYNL